jgi:hypothetical protein
MSIGINKNSGKSFMIIANPRKIPAAYSFFLYKPYSIPTSSERRIRLIWPIPKVNFSGNDIQIIKKIMVNISHEALVICLSNKSETPKQNNENVNHIFDDTANVINEIGIRMNKVTGG